MAYHKRDEVYLRLNITYLIGNGFDRNMGLSTSFSDFLEEFLKKAEGDDLEIEKFKEDIRKREIEDRKEKRDTTLWSNAELAFGEYTDDVAKEPGGTAERFSRRHPYFCRQLAEYLQKQEARVSMEGREKAFIQALLGFETGLSSVQRQAVKDAMNRIGGGYVINVLDFNYTEPVDVLIRSIRSGKAVLGRRQYNGREMSNEIRMPVHVHGTTRRHMVLGVAGDSQIKNLELFADASPIYKQSLIKQQTNALYEERTDELGRDIIKNSDIIYIYGMSLGDTDEMWWRRIVQAMRNQSHLHVFIYGYGLPQDELLMTDRKIQEENLKDRLLSFSEGDGSALKPRIHVVSHNIFSELEGIASSEEDVAEGKVTV